MLRRTIVFAFLALVVAGCSGGAVGPNSTAPGTSGATTSTASVGGSGSDAAGAVFDPGSVHFVAALERFDSCSALLDYFHSEALARVGPYGLGGGPVYWALEGDTATTMAPGTTAGEPVPQTADEGAGYSTTNVQVVGVDEPDVIETDGRRIVAISNSTLYYFEVDGSGARLAGSLALPEGWNSTFFMQGDRALVFSQGNSLVMPMEEPVPLVPTGTGPETVVQEVDLSHPEAMRVVRTLRIEGTYVSARAVDGIVRLVISSYPSDLPFVYPSSAAADDLALETNRRVVEQSTLEDWLPSFSLFEGDQQVSQGLLVDCAQTQRPAEFAGFDTLSVLTLDLGAPLGAPAGAAVIAEGETVYASTDYLFVATNVWVPTDLMGDPSLEPIDQDYSTAIHAFDISGGGPVRYLASASVPGHLLSQFSMDEYQGYLRVATTAGPPWGSDPTSESMVTVLSVDQGGLPQVGQVGDLGRGESIYAVRFIGAAGYVVTFRQTDPLYVLDLRSPSAPAVTGELALAGYSAYLHPLGDGRLLGVGSDATAQGAVTGAKVTLFDVSDPADPRVEGTWTLPGGYSDVEFDHLAFLYWAPAQLAVLPMQDWSGGFVGAVVLSTQDGLSEVGRVTHDVDQADGSSDCRLVPPPAEGYPGVVVQVCGPGDSGGMSGHSCEVIPADSVGDLLSGFGVGTLDLAPDERVEVCWPDYYSAAPIERSLVIGDTLWTLSTMRLQGNALDGLPVTSEIPLG
jgi:hypothetical protein